MLFRSLGETADDKSDKVAAREAAKRLQTLALEAGFTKEKIDEADNWSALASMIIEAGSSSPNEEGEETPAEEEEAGETEETSEEWEPAKEEVYKYSTTAKGPNGKPMKKKVEVEVTAVNKAKRLVTLKSLADGKTVYKDVSWDALEANE